jgi:hypothetical protein
MSKDPAVLFYTSDFLTGVTLMSMAQRGQYITLLCLQHQKGHLSEKELKKICRNDTAVLEKFIQDENGLYYNERMETEIDKREAHCTKQRENILKRWNKDGIYDGNTMVLPLENENESIDKDIKKRDKEGTGGKEEKAVDVNLYVEVFNSLCTKLPKVLKLTDKRKKKIRDFAKDFSIDEFKIICANLNGSEWYTGKNDRGWKADFDYIMRTDKASKFLEGKEQSTPQDKPGDKQAWELLPWNENGFKTPVHPDKVYYIQSATDRQRYVEFYAAHGIKVDLRRGK